MMSWTRRLALPLVLLVATLLGHAPAVAQDTLRVFAAASMKTALDRIATNFTQTTGIRLNLSYGASSALARQIEQGAPADVFISADEDWMDYLVTRGAVATETRRPLVGNRLVLIAPAASPVSFDFAAQTPLAGLLGSDGRLAIADPRAVPAGKYARMALQNLNQWSALEARLAPAENVRVALGMVARGEAPLGIVYASDQLAEPATRVVARLPESSHVPIIYPVAALKDGQRDLAGRFLSHLAGTGATDILRASGFVILTGGRSGS